MDSYIVRKLKAFEKTKSNSSKKYYSNSPLPHSYLKLLRWLNFRSISTGANCTPTRINGNQRTDTASSFPVRFSSIAPLFAILLFKNKNKKERKKEILRTNSFNLLFFQSFPYLLRPRYQLKSFFSTNTDRIAHRRLLSNESDRSNST